jgi:exosortase/archaeosortase
MQLAHPLIYVLDITGYTALEEFLPVQLHTHPCLRNQNMFTRSTFWEMRPSNLVMRTVIEATMTKQINKVTTEQILKCTSSSSKYF